jgi:hypothetical protein
MNANVAIPLRAFIRLLLLLLVLLVLLDADDGEARVAPKFNLYVILDAGSREELSRDL